MYGKSIVFLIKLNNELSLWDWDCQYENMKLKCFIGGMEECGGTCPGKNYILNYSW